MDSQKRRRRALVLKNNRALTLQCKTNRTLPKIDWLVHWDIPTQSFLLTPRAFKFTTLTAEHVEVLLAYAFQNKLCHLFGMICTLSKHGNRLANEFVANMPMPCTGDDHPVWKPPFFLRRQDKLSWAFDRCWQCMLVAHERSTNFFHTHTESKHTVLVCKRCEKDLTSSYIHVMRSVTDGDEVLLIGRPIASDFGVAAAWEAISKRSYLEEIHDQVWRGDDNRRKIYNAVLISFVVMEVKKFFRMELTLRQTRAMFGARKPKIGSSITNPRAFFYLHAPTISGTEKPAFFHELSLYAIKINKLRTTTTGERRGIRSVRKIPKCCHGETHTCRGHKWVLHSCGACDGGETAEHDV